MDAHARVQPEPIRALIEALAAAIWKRQLEDRGFDFHGHLLNPCDYRLVTAAEVGAWESLTHPGRYEELAAFVEQWRQLPANDYALAMGYLLRKESRRRRATPPDLADRA